MSLDEAATVADVTTRRRLPLVAVAVLVVLAGLAVQTLRPAAWADVGGTVLYAALVYVVLALVWPSAVAARIGLATAAVCTSIELLQLTGAAASLSAAFAPARLVVGTTFAWVDLLAYTAGAASAALLDAGGRRSRARRRAVTS